MTLGSLFDGSGTCPLAAAMCGITPVWASEIEPYPIRVTQKNFPRMKHLGDITQINGADAAPLWYDSKDYSDANRWMVIDLPELAFGSAATVKRLVNSQFYEPTYGEKWRCWLRKPTEAERRGTPWACDSRE